MKTKIPHYSHQCIDKQDIAAVVKTLKSQYLTQGPKIDEFEKALCKYTGAKYAVAVSNGTAALHLSCMVAGITSKDEVITSPYTFLATSNAVLYCGGKPVFADIQKNMPNLDLQETRKKITKKTKAIIPVHFAGYPCDLKGIKKLAKKNKLLVIEDAAHAFGAKYEGSRIGSCDYSDLTILSFHPLKSITTGEGGAILTNNYSFYKKLRSLRAHGVIKDGLKKKNEGKWYYEMSMLGFNYRLSDIQAALGISQLKKLNSFVKQRCEIAKLYNKFLKNNDYFEIPDEKLFPDSSHHIYYLKLKDPYRSKRKAIVDTLRSKGLGVQVHYIPVHLQPFYTDLGYKKGICPIAEDLYDREISLPIYPGLKKQQVLKIIELVLETFKNVKKNA